MCTGYKKKRRPAGMFVFGETLQHQIVSYISVSKTNAEDVNLYHHLL